LEIHFMASAWIQNGPVSLPPRSLAFGAGAALCLLAFVGVGLGLRAAWRETGLPDLSGAASSAVSDADVITAKPVVDLPAATNTDVNAASNSDADDKGDKDIAEKTAEAQQVQAKSSQPAGDIDQILTSPTEKPTAPKPTTDEAPPAPPVKSDVPF
jgi:hypothetical protein